MGWLFDVLRSWRRAPRDPRWHEIFFEGLPLPETLCWVARTGPGPVVPVEVALYSADDSHTGWLGLSWWESPGGAITHWMPVLAPSPPVFRRRVGLLLEEIHL